MFRKPMRLEKWIAFDGAAVADVVQAANVDADANDDSRHVDPFAPDSADADAASAHADDDGPAVLFAPAAGPLANNDFVSEDLTIVYNNGGNTAHGSLTIPKEIDTDGKDGSFVFRDGHDEFDSGHNPNIAPGKDFFFEISPPDGGEFFFYKMSDYLTNQQRADFIAQHGLETGDIVAFALDPDANGVSVLRFWQVNADRTDLTPPGVLVSQTPAVGWCSTAADGSIRFTINGNGWTTHGNGVVNAVFDSIGFKSSGSDVPPKVGGFEVSVYHVDGAGSNLATKQALFHSADPSNPDVFSDPVRQPLGEVEVPVWVAPPSGGSDDTPPIVNPPPGGGDSDGGDTGDDAGDDGDAGDDAVEADAGGDPVFIVQREAMSDDDSAYDAAADDGDAETIHVELEQTDEGGVESADAALTADLLREAEALLESVRGDRDVLLQSLSALQIEYLRQDLRLEGPARDFLRELFEWGDREKIATSRVIDEMHRQLGTLAVFSGDQRDGMLLESLRELIESAERRSGEMGALSRGLEAVVALLAGWSERGQIPDVTEARAVFEDVHGAALADWAARAERLDPMGRDLSAAVQ